MAKAIKFNLIIDKQPVRDLDDLVANFNVEDVLEAFQNGSLKRWLDVHGFNEQRDLLADVKGDYPDKAKALCGIFLPECSGTEIETAAYAFDFKQKERETLAAYKNLAKQEAEIIARYHKGYDILLTLLEGKANDYAFLKPAIEALVAKYRGLFILNVADFYSRFVFDFPLVILTALANKDMRPLLTNVISETMMFEHLTELSCAIESFKKRFKENQHIPMLKFCQNEEELAALKASRKTVFVLSISTDSELDSSGGTAIMEVFETEKLKPPFQYIDRTLSYPSHVKAFADDTDGRFTHLESAGKRFMIIKMEEGNIVMKRDGLKEDELKAADVNGKFVILDGVDYCGKNDADSLIYMEV